MIEVTKFRLNESTSSDLFHEVNAEYQTDFVYHQSGLRRRTVAPGLGGEWLWLTCWDSKPDADRAAQEARRSSIAQRFEACIDPSSTTVEYFRELPG